MFGIGKNKNQRGFSIIEMTVVLTVIALIAGTALSVSTNSRNHNNIKETREKMDFIFTMLERYVAAYQHLPCPADPSLQTNNASFGDGTNSGVEPLDPSNFVGGFPCQATLNEERSNSPGSSGSPVYAMAGIVPIKQLGISPTYILDAWGRRMMYVVDHNLTWSGPAAGTLIDNVLYATDNGEYGFTDRCVDGDIRILRQTSPIRTQSAEAAVVLISYGKNGHGAWPAKGGQRLDKSIGATNTDELENSYNGNGVSEPGNSFDANIVQKYSDTEEVTGAGEYFDDVVEYRTKWQLDPNYIYSVDTATACP